MKPTLDHVLVATDFSASASAAVDHAATLARRAGARLHLVQVLEEPFVTSGPYQWHMPDTPVRREGRYQQALVRLSKDAAAVSKAALTPTIEVRCGEVTEKSVQMMRLSRGAYACFARPHSPADLAKRLATERYDRRPSVRPHLTRSSTDVPSGPGLGQRLNGDTLLISGVAK